MFRYRNKIKQLSGSFSKLKYALKLINRPKLVYLISEGIKKGVFVEKFEIDTYHGDKNSDSHIETHFFKYLKDISRAINEGGRFL